MSRYLISSTIQDAAKSGIQFTPDMKNILSYRRFVPTFPQDQRKIR